VTKEQIDYMVNRFLGWTIPDTFCPDGGVKFTKIYNEGTPYQGENKPVGTNIFTATEATAMVKNMLEGLPSAFISPSSEPYEINQTGTGSLKIDTSVVMRNR
jgi:hypothetical protein